MGVADQKDSSGYNVYNTRHNFCHLSRHALPNDDSRITNLQRNTNTYTRSGEKLNKLVEKACVVFNEISRVLKS